MEAVHCAVCHADVRDATAMGDNQNHGIAPHDLWASSSMAHSARDPNGGAALSAQPPRSPAPVSRPRQSARGAMREWPMPNRFSLDGPLLAHLPTAMGEPTPVLDGVSCTVCHQILPVEQGDELHYSGGYK